MTSSKRIVLVGRTGQVARSIYEALTADGHTVIVLGRPEIDLSQPHTLREAILGSCPDLVVNAAAYTLVDRAESETELAFAINATGAAAVAEAAALSNVPVVHFSTDYVFDGTKSAPYDETDMPAPLSVYGRTKLEGERRVANGNPRHVILRTAWVCSPYGNNFVKTILRLSAERAELRVVNDQRGSPTFARDLAAVVCELIPHLLSSSADANAFGVFHAVNGGATTWFAFARSIMDGAKLRGLPHVPVRPISSSAYPFIAQRPSNSVLSTEKLYAHYHLRLQHWEDALSRCLDQLCG